MKKTTLAVALSISLVTWILSSSSYAVDTVLTPPSASPTLSQTEADEPVQYTLPYPGMLPDHPLYPLKKFRDRLLDFLIYDPVKRIEFNLLMADKRYHMGMFFSDEQKYDRAYSIVEEAETFYGRIPEEIQAAKDNSRTIPPDLLQNIKTAAEKHKEIIIMLKNDNPEDMPDEYQEILD
ncbi:hypothetical protein HY469_01340, partial [Candidatus Roizmanbacteria bacterium]|nr:hypothetical protein [Candidatus Roizmanbacteria bacterium]